MFLGEFKHSIDEKGRIALPAKFRSSLKGRVVITRGLDRCLFVYPVEEWEKLAQKLSSLPISQANTRAFARLMLAGASEESIDSQGRFLIPKYLRDYAFLKKKTVVAGLFSRIEMWDEQTWEDYKAKTEKESNEIAERMQDLGV